MSPQLWLEKEKNKKLTIWSIWHIQQIKLIQTL